MAKLTDKVALITGASSGIGKGIAEVYAEHGAKLILVDISEEIVNFAEELKEDGHQVLAEVADVRSLEDLKSAVNKGIERFETIHALVANAGVCKLDNFLEMSDKNRDYHIDINIKGAWNTIKAVLPEM